MSEPASTRLLDRLRQEGIIHATADCVLSRRHRNGATRAAGKWSWQVSWTGDGMIPVRVAVSRFSMQECATAGRWEVVSVWLSSHGCPGQVILPVGDEKTRRRRSEAAYSGAEPGQVWIAEAAAIQGRIIRITGVRAGRVTYEVLAPATHRARANNSGRMRVDSLRVSYRPATAGEVKAMTTRREAR